MVCYNLGFAFATGDIVEVYVTHNEHLSFTANVTVPWWWCFHCKFWMGMNLQQIWSRQPSSQTSASWTQAGCWRVLRKVDVLMKSCSHPGWLQLLNQVSKNLNCLFICNTLYAACVHENLEMKHSVMASELGTWVLSTWTKTALRWRCACAIQN